MAITTTPRLGLKHWSDDNDEWSREDWAANVEQLEDLAATALPYTFGLVIPGGTDLTTGWQSTRTANESAPGGGFPTWLERRPIGEGGALWLDQGRYLVQIVAHFAIGDALYDAGDVLGLGYTHDNGGTPQYVRVEELTAGTMAAVLAAGAAVYHALPPATFLFDADGVNPIDNSIRTFVYRSRDVAADVYIEHQFIKLI
jgi:hypothetical protein